MLGRILLKKENRRECYLLSGLLRGLLGVSKRNEKFIYLN